MTDKSPGYGGVNVTAKVLRDSTPAVTHLLVTSADCSPLKEVTKETCVIIGGDYYIATTKEIAEGIKTISNGPITGLLAIPFKYHFTDHGATSGTTLGGYVGYERNWSYLGSAAWIVGGGLAMVPTTTTTTNFSAATTPAAGTTTVTKSTSDSSLYGITIATGLIGKIGQTNAQFGVLVGIDLVNKSENYKYDGKPWLSFSFGYAFTK